MIDMSTYKFIKGQTHEILNFTLLDADGAAVDITGATITLSVFSPKSMTELFSGACSIVSAVDGTFKYEFAANDLSDAGLYEGEIEITFADSTIGKIQGFYIEIEDSP